MEMVSCSLCTLEIDGRAHVTVRYPACGHVIHLKCFIDDPDFVYFVSDCKTCVICSFNRPERNEKGRKSNSSKMPSVFPPRGLDIKDHVKQAFAMPGGISQNPISDMGDSYKRQASIIDIVSSGLQQEYSNKATGFRSSSSKGSDNKMRQGKAFAHFVDTINSDFGSTVLVLAKGEDRHPPSSNPTEDTEHKNSGPSRTLALPYEIGGIQTWVSTRSEKHTIVATDLRAGKYIEPSLLSKNGFSVLNMVETGISLHTLMNVNNYTLQELTSFGFTWAGFVAIGLTMDYFKMEGVYLIDINVMIQYFPGLSVYDLITLPPANVTPMARLEVFTSLGFTTKILLLLRFDIPCFSDILSAQAFLNLGKTIPLDDISGKLHLHGEILRAKDLLNKGFFKAMGWTHPLKYITHVLNVNEISIEQYGLLDDDDVDEPPQSVIKESPRITSLSTIEPFALGISSIPTLSSNTGYGSVQQQFLTSMENPQDSNIIGKHDYSRNKNTQYRGNMKGYSTSSQ